MSAESAGMLRIWPARAPRGGLSKLGGRPWGPPGMPWPTCRSCQGPMQFLAQIRLSQTDLPVKDGLLLLFQCQNQPGLCDEWEPEKGGNAAVVVPTEGLAELTPPRLDAAVLLDSEIGLLLEPANRWTKILRALARKASLGQIGGTPDWIQADETPSCCGRPMTIVVQLEEVFSMNFGGGGCGYGFVCTECLQARFLWQC